MKLRLTLALAALACATPALAEPTCFDAPPKHECKQPDPLGLQPSNAQIKAYNKAFEAYKACMEKYLATRAAEAKAIESVHKQIIDAHASAWKEFNDWATQTAKDNAAQ